MTVLSTADDDDKLVNFLQNLLHHVQVPKMKRLKPANIKPTPNQHAPPDFR
jgi:hypothetical protein